MVSQRLSQEQVRDLTIKNWMTHDSLWYDEVATRFGMTAASPMNLRICRKLGQIEFKRLMKIIHASPPKDIVEYQELFELGKKVFFPDFIVVEITYPGSNSQVFRVSECFAYRGMEKVQRIGDYECGIFERIEGWFDAMDLKYTRSPDLSRCLRFKGEACRVRAQFHFQ